MPKKKSDENKEEEKNKKEAIESEKNVAGKCCKMNFCGTDKEVYPKTNCSGGCAHP